MFNRRIEITKENESILFINAVIENLRYAIISLDEIFYKKDYSGYYDEHTFYFFHIQSILTAQGNIYNVLFNDYFVRRKISRERVRHVREDFGIDLAKFPLVGNKKFRNSNAHFDERYYQFNNIGDMNILRSETPESERRQILETPHLRTIDIDIQSIVSDVIKLIQFARVVIEIIRQSALLFYDIKGVEKTEEKCYNRNNLTIEGKIVWKIKSRFLRINKSERLGTQTKKNGIFLWWT